MCACMHTQRKHGSKHSKRGRDKKSHKHKKDKDKKKKKKKDKGKALAPAAKPKLTSGDDFGKFGLIREVCACGGGGGWG